jgi:hypothetical protein
MIPLFVHNDTGLVIQPISKNASSSADMVFSEWKQQKWVPAEVPQSTPAIVIVLRDPYERFLSALNMFMNLDKSYIWKADGFTRCFPFLQHNLSEIRINDTHFAPQTIVGFIQQHLKHHPEKVKFFWMDASCSHTVWSDVLSWANRSFSGGFREDSARVNVGGKRFVTEIDRDLIYKTYEKDYELISSITASKSWINLQSEHQVIQTNTGCPATPERWR